MGPTLCLQVSSWEEAVLGVLDRLVLSDAQWARLSTHIIGDERSRGTSGRDNRMFVEGVLWIVRTGSPPREPLSRLPSCGPDARLCRAWRDLPEIFGEWNSVFRRFSRWSRKGVWWRIFAAMSDDPDFEYLIVDSTIIRAHQHASGAKKGGLKIRPLSAAPTSLRGIGPSPMAVPAAG